MKTTSGKDPFGESRNAVLSKGFFEGDGKKFKKMILCTCYLVMSLFVDRGVYYAIPKSTPPPDKALLGVKCWIKNPLKRIIKLNPNYHFYTFPFNQRNI